MTRLIRVSDDLLDLICTSSGRGSRLSYEWGEPDAEGVYEPIFTEHNDNNSLDRHVTPEVDSEAPAHVLDGTCWCQPVVDYADPLTGDRVYVHRRTMDGPAYEPVPA